MSTSHLRSSRFAFVGLGVLSLCLLLLVTRGPRHPAHLERSEPPAEAPVVSSLPARKALAAVSLKGLVKSAYGEPVREGTVTFSRDGVSMKAVTLENDGTFSASLVPGQYRIVVSSPIWGDLIADHEVLREDAVLELIYEATAVVEGRIIGGADLTDDCSWLSLRLHGPLDPGDAPCSREPVRAEVDCAARRFAIENLGPGEFMVAGVYRGYAMESSFTIEKNGEKKIIEVDLDARPGHVFRGLALLEGVPLPAIELTARIENDMHATNEVMTEADGRFRLESPLLGWGASVLFHRSPDRKPVRLRFDSRTRAGMETVVNFEDTAGRRGILVNEDRAPLPFVTLSIWSYKTYGHFQLTTDSEGAFMANHVPPGKYFQVTVSTATDVMKQSDIIIPEPEETFILEADVQQVLYLSVKAGDELVDWYMARIYPVLKPSQSRWIRLWGITFQHAPIVPRTIAGLPAEAIVVEVLSLQHGWGRDIVDLSSGTRELTVALKPPRDVEMSIVDASGSPLPEVHLSIPEFSDQKVVTPQFSFQEPVEPWSPGAQVIKAEPSKPHRFRVYPGEGSRVKLWASSEENAVVLDADDLLERSVLVLE